MNNSNSKVEEEKTILKFFSETYTDFPEGKLIKTESPDFVIKLNPKESIGIELTRLIPSGSAVRRKSKKAIFEKEIIEKTRQVFELQNKRKIFITFYFRENILSEDWRLNDLPEKIAGIISDKLTNIPAGVFRKLIVRYPILHESIDTILVLPYPDLRISLWRNASSTITPGKLREVASRSIADKENKLLLYQKKKINKYWLLLIIDKFSGSNSVNKLDHIENWPVRSAFHKIFLFELLSGKLFILK